MTKPKVSWANPELRISRTSTAFEIYKEAVIRKLVSSKVSFGLGSLMDQSFKAIDYFIENAKKFEVGD